FQAEDGIRDATVTGVQTCALPIYLRQVFAYWFTFSGGEPTLRKDLPEMVEAAYRHCHPGIINIPTNGIQDKIIPGRIERVLQARSEERRVGKGGRGRRTRADRQRR